jgi:hypothetical protein
MVWDVDQSIGTVTTADGEVNIAQAMMVKPAGSKEGNQERKANTRLIAAAPELLAALIALRDAEWGDASEILARRKAADAAIAKATS